MCFFVFCFCLVECVVFNNYRYLKALKVSNWHERYIVCIAKTRLFMKLVILIPNRFENFHSAPSNFACSRCCCVKGGLHTQFTVCSSIFINFHCTNIFGGIRGLWAHKIHSEVYQIV